MGVLSARSFVAPLIDKRNLIAILLIGIFFAVYRLSGGSVEILPPHGHSNQNTKPISQPSLFERFAGTEPTSPAEDVKRLHETENAPQNEDLLGNMLNHKPTRSPAENGQGNSNKLDDIERSLGLR